MEEKAGFCTISAGDCAFWRKKPDSAQFQLEIVHFRRKKPDSAQFQLEIVHFSEEKAEFCTISAEDCAFSSGKSRILHNFSWRLCIFCRKKLDSAQSQLEIVHLKKKT